MNNINRQINRTVDYLIDVEVDGVHVCNDTTVDDVDEVRGGVSENLVESTKRNFSRVSCEKITIEWEMVNTSRFLIWFFVPRHKFKLISFRGLLTRFYFRNYVKSLTSFETN